MKENSITRDEEENAHCGGAAHVEEFERRLVNEQRQYPRRVCRARRPVMISGTAKTFIATITFITTTSSVVGLSSGRVMFQKLAQRPAPSILRRVVVVGRDGLQAGQENDHVIRRGAPDADRG